MMPGIVSNCWQWQLAHGILLEDLLGQALDRGYHVIELRQTCLGGFEDCERGFPKVSALGSLTSQFPEIQFNLALSLPFLGRIEVSEDPLFKLAVEAAQALSGRFFPHLRLVDLDTSDGVLKGRELEIAHQIFRLALPLVDSGGWLSLEHSLQPWVYFSKVVKEARQLLGSCSARLRVCYDPANLLVAPDHPDPSLVVRNLDVTSLSMIHLKQFKAEQFQTTVESGEIDWQTQFSVLDQLGYVGPALFEVQSARDVWTNLDRSRTYLESLGGCFAGGER